MSVDVLLLGLSSVVPVGTAIAAVFWTVPAAPADNVAVRSMRRLWPAARSMVALRLPAPELGAGQVAVDAA